MHDALSAAVARPTTWVILVVAIAAWPVAWSLRTPLPPRLPVLGTVPVFDLTAQDGRPFGSNDLAGRVWLLSFVSTRSETGAATTFAAVQSRTRNLEPDFHLVSISVEPDLDTPERLADYARAHRASPRMWTFLTGSTETVRDAVAHGTELVLVDREGRIRGYYDPRDAEVVKRVVRDAALLVNRG
ncbi:MAG TPA: SCO family protein [Myxococcales bacterium]|nr:SCO family protein [Myxococcales bacterium]